MALHARLLTPTDYDTILVQWWSDWGWAAPARDFLPEGGLSGVMILDDDTPVCAGFFYTTNSKAAWVDWIISNKEYKKKPQRKEALALLIQILTATCKNLGFSYVYALIKHPSLVNVYKSIGYTEGDSYNKEMIIKL
jgi:hypothetical protein